MGSAVSLEGFENLRLGHVGAWISILSRCLKNLNNFCWDVGILLVGVEISLAGVEISVFENGTGWTSACRIPCSEHVFLLEVSRIYPLWGIGWAVIFSCRCRDFGFREWHRLNVSVSYSMQWARVSLGGVLVFPLIKRVTHQYSMQA
jgi:hypothetical protein